MKIGIILGTRPEIIKIAPLIEILKKERISFFVINTGQHYSFSMNKIFFEELNLPLPDYNLNINSNPDFLLISKMIEKIGKVIKNLKPSIILVQGDTNSTLAGALTSSKLGVKLAHVEAGLRSFDRNMPEEINRIIVDHISDLLFVPTEIAKKNLLNEGIKSKKIFIVGNTIVDSIKKYILFSEKTGYKFIKSLGLIPKQYLLLTIHRKENVDNYIRLKEILNGMKKIKEVSKMPIIFPIHPRTQKNVFLFKLNNLLKSMMVIQPVGYLEFLFLLKESKLVFTDSGGIQEESCILKVPCITLRENTERPETIKIGCNILVGYDREKIINGFEKMLSKKINWKNPYGDGKTSIKIINVIKNYLKNGAKG